MKMYLTQTEEKKKKKSTDHKEPVIRASVIITNIFKCHVATAIINSNI